MSKTATVHARIEPKLKKQAEGILHRLGLNQTQAITLFYKQVELHAGLPFDIVIPNKTTLQTFQNTDAGRNLVVCEDVKDMFKKLGI